MAIAGFCLVVRGCFGLAAHHLAGLVGGLDRCRRGACCAGVGSGETRGKWWFDNGNPWEMVMEKPTIPKLYGFLSIYVVSNSNCM